MSERRRFELLEHLFYHGDHRPDITAAEALELLRGGFIDTEGDEVIITTLGEMELEDLHALT
jgi:hypothetical protein